MLWLFSALGIGGIGAALFLIPGAAAKAIEIAAAVWAAVTKYPREAAIIALLLACGWLYIGKGKANDRADAIEAQAKADNALWQHAHKVEAKSLADVTGALNGWSAYTRKWSATSQRQQRASQARYKAATARRDVSEGVAARIERAGVSGGCVTAPEIMQSRGEL